MKHTILPFIFLFLSACCADRHTTEAKDTKDITPTINTDVNSGTSNPVIISQYERNTRIVSDRDRNVVQIETAPKKESTTAEDAMKALDAKIDSEIQSSSPNK